MDRSKSNSKCPKHIADNVQCSLNQDASERCALCDGTKVRRVSYQYLANAAQAPRIQRQYPPPPPKKDHKRDHGHGSRSGRGVYNQGS